MYKVLIMSALCIAAVSYKAQAQHVVSKTVSTRTNVTTITGNGDIKTVTANGGDVVVTGDGNVITVQGKARRVTVVGSGNALKINSVEIIDIKGDANAVKYLTAPTKTAKAGGSTRGSGNAVGKVKSFD